MLLKNSSLSFLFLILLAISGLYCKDFSTRGEGREALVAQSILKNGDWVLPRGFNNEVPSKPPFMHWLVAGVSLPFSEVTEETSRIPSMALSIIALLIFYRFLNARKGKAFALCTVFITATSIEWLRASTACRVDMCLSASLLVGFISFFIWFETKSRFSFLASIACFSVATLCKGPVALALPLGVIAIFLWDCGERSAIKFFRVTAGIFIPASLIALSWYYLGYLDGGQEFIKKVYDENVSRLMGTLEDAPHSHGFLYLWSSLLLMYLPWTLPFLLILFCKVRVAKPKFGLIAGFWKSLERFTKYSLIIIVVFIGFFSIPEGKRSVYLLPIYPFIAFCLSSIYWSISESDLLRFKTGVRFFSGFILTAFIAVAIFLTCPIDQLTNYLGLQKQKEIVFIWRLAQELVANINPLGFLAIAGLLILALRGIRKEMDLNHKTIIYQFIVIILALETTIQGIVLNTATNLISGKTFSSELKTKIGNGQPIYSFGYEFYCLSFYLEKTLHRVDPDTLPDGGVVLLFEDKLDQLRKVLGPGRTLSILTKSQNSIEETGKYVLLVTYSRANML